MPLQIFNADISSSQIVAGGRNRLTNGDMRIDQRNSGASQTITAAAALAYTVDRWYAYCTGANITGQQITTSGQKRYVFTGATSNTAVGFGQRIEAINSLDLAGSMATLQCKLSSTSLTSITWTASYATTTADTFGTLASPTVTQIATGTFTINSTESIYSAQIQIPAAAITGIQIVFTGGALLGAQTLTISDVQFEPGIFATPFEKLKYGIQLAECQRYAWKFNASLGNTIYASNASGTLDYPAVMRAAPTLAAGAAYTTQAGNAGTVSIIGSGTGGGDTTTCSNFYNGGAAWTVTCNVSVAGLLTAEL